MMGGSSQAPVPEPGGLGLVGLRRHYGLWALPWLTFSLLSAAGMARVAAGGAGLQWVAASLLVLWLLLTVHGVWAGIGAWRAAQALRRRDGPPLWGLLAQGSLVLAGLLTATSLVLDVLPQGRNWVLLALGQDPLGGLTSQVSANGQKLQWSGAIGQGDAARVHRWLAAAPQIHLIELDSPGGRLDEARLIAQALTERGASTRVSGLCVDACMVVFMAGRARQLMPQAQLGFRRPTGGSWLPVFAIPIQRQVAASYRDAGLPDRLIARALGGSRSAIWTLDAYDIQADGLLGSANRPLDVAAPFDPAAPLGEYIDAFTTHPIWRAVEARYPGTLGAAAAQMQASRAGTGTGAGDGDTLQLAAQGVLQPLWRSLLMQADVPLRQKFAELLADELRAVRSSGPQACALLLAGDVGVRRQLPAALVLRAAEWLTDALAETQPAGAPRPLSGIEREVMRRTLGSAAPQALANLQPWPKQPKLGCADATALLDAVVRLPIPERRLALRLLAGAS